MPGKTSVYSCAFQSKAVKPYHIISDLRNTGTGQGRAEDWKILQRSTEQCPGSNPLTSKYTATLHFFCLQYFWVTLIWLCLASFALQFLLNICRSREKICCTKTDVLFRNIQGWCWRETACFKPNSLRLSWGRAVCFFLHLWFWGWFHRGVTDQ